MDGKEYWHIDCTNDNEVAEKLDRLNRLGFLFVEGLHGWPPAGIFDYFREKKMLKGKFKQVTWRMPGDWVIRER